MRWGNEDIVELRARLISNVTMLTAFVRYLSFERQYQLSVTDNE